MRFFRRVAAYVRIARHARRNRADLHRWLVRRPAILGAVYGYEFGALVSNRVEPRLKHLAVLKTSSLIGCAFCLDLGSAFGTAMGIEERQLAELGRYQESAAFDEVERLVLDLAVAMSTTPTSVTDDLREALLGHFTRGQLTELASAVAWEHHRARLNRALGIRAMGFSDDGACVLPEAREHPPIPGTVAEGRSTRAEQAVIENAEQGRLPGALGAQPASSLSGRVR